MPAENLAAMHVGAMQPARVVIGIDLGRGFEPHDGAEFLGVLVREMQHDASADGAAHHDRAVELERG